MGFSFNGVGWIGTGILALILGFVINSTIICSTCSGKGTIFLYVGVIVIVLGLALGFGLSGKKRRR